MNKSEIKKEEIKTEDKNNNQQLYNGIWKVQFENKESAKVKVNKKR